MTGARHPDTHGVGRLAFFDRLLFAAAVAVPLAVLVAVSTRVGVSLVGLALGALLLGKIVIGLRFRSSAGARAMPSGDPALRVCAVIPAYNEDPAFLVAAIRSMLAQQRRPDRLHVVDDGSGDDGSSAAAARDVLSAEAGDLEWEVTRLATNQGKRAALAVGFGRDPLADIYLCVDSDTVLEPAAIAEGLGPFADPGTSAVTGFVMAHNWRINWLTRLVDLRYVSAFLTERAAYSYFGAVLCCCGSLSFYRADVVRANLADFVDQRFLGHVATFGDDRRLTNYALRAGRVVLCPTARAATGVPERIPHYLRQQIRWNKSFMRESAWVLGTFPLRHPAFWLTLFEVVTWALFGLLLTAAIVLCLLIGTAPVPWATLGTFIAATAYLRNAAYLATIRPGMSRRDRLATLFLAPLYGALHLGVLVPLRLWALLTLRRGAWGTRHQIELAYAP